MNSDRGKATTQQGKRGSKRSFGKNYLTRLWDWSLNDQKEAKELIVEYASIFAMRHMDLGETSLVKLSIR